MSLEDACSQLGWPEPKEVLEPTGAGPRVFVELVKQKIEQALHRMPDGRTARVGVLARDPKSDSTEEPLAIVCEFKKTASPQTLAEAHRLAWNFCRARILLIVEPTLVRAWSCCPPPRSNPYPQGSLLTLETPSKHPAEVIAEPLGKETPASLTDQVARSLHWLNLISGEFVRSKAEHFADNGRADRVLLSDLRAVRNTLTSEKNHSLPKDVTHDLLARIIFIQFLFDRKDKSGRAALTSQELSDLHRTKILFRSLTPVLAKSFVTTMMLIDFFVGSTRNSMGIFSQAEEKQRHSANWSGKRRWSRSSPLTLNCWRSLLEGRLKIGQYSTTLPLAPICL